MVSQRPLKPLFLVRVQAPQHHEKHILFLFHGIGTSDRDRDDTV